MNRKLLEHHWTEKVSIKKEAPAPKVTSLSSMDKPNAF